MENLPKYRNQLADPLYTIEAIRELDSLRATISEDWRRAQADLAIKRNRFLEPKTNTLTELDRTTRVDAATAAEEALANELGDLYALAGERCDLAMRLLLNE